MEKLTANELVNLVKTVFPAMPNDRRLAILVDVPRNPVSDNPAWRLRRQLAGEWYAVLESQAGALGLQGIDLIAYPDVGSNGADLPQYGFLMREKLPHTAFGLDEAGEKMEFTKIFQDFQLYLAPTEYSTTPPLKKAAPGYGFRAATMPGFSPAMIPALRFDYTEISRRVSRLKELLDPADRAEVVFTVNREKTFKMLFDLRFRTAHLSSGRFPEPGTAGNLPSGETYIVPYEGEKGEKSGTTGILPVQIGSDILLFTVEENRAIHVESYFDGPESEELITEQAHLRRDPVYGNMAELGFGVLGDFGLMPINEILLDEKLGFHVAFGRSDHFGGIVGPGDFSSPSAVIHLDRIYIPATQPLIEVTSIVLGFANRPDEPLMKDNRYLIF